MPRLTSDDVWGFVNLVLAQGLDGRVPTPEFHRELWDLCCSDFRYVAVAAPRGHAKSTSVSLAFVLASALFRDSPYTIIISETEEQASEFLGDIKVALTENEDLIKLFGVAKVVRDTQSDIIVRMTDGYVFRIIAKGSEQKIRGRKWRGMRPKMIIGDDLEGDEQVLNKDRRDKFKRWVRGAVLPALADDGRARFVGTILHMDAFLESKMPNERDPKTVKTDLCVKNMVPGKLWASARYRAHNEDFSKILWPEKFPPENLNALRHDFIEDGIPEVYSQEYLNYPIDESSAYFRRDDFIPMTDEDRLKKNGITQPQTSRYPRTIELTSR